MSFDIQAHFDTIKAEQDNLDTRYPNRHREIHKVCCKQCPSNNNLPDMEAQDIKDTCSKEVIVKEYLFVCAWRESKLCKGYCDFNDIDEDFIKQVHGG